MGNILKIISTVKIFTCNKDIDEDLSLSDSYDGSYYDNYDNLISYQPSNKINII